MFVHETYRKYVGILRDLDFNPKTEKVILEPQ